MDEKCGHGLKRFQLLSEHNLFGKSKVQQAYPNLVANTFQQVHFFPGVSNPANTVRQNNDPKPVFPGEQRNTDTVAAGAKPACAYLFEILRSEERRVGKEVR